MNVYIILSQASYDDGFNIHSLHKSEELANEKAKKLYAEENSKYVTYWIEEWELEE